MRVSVLVPSHNYARFVGKAVDSVLAQDYAGPVECIVVDDGSTDGTSEVLGRYRDRITVIRQENLGMAAALNAAFEASSGDVLCFLDADDEWRPDKLSVVADVFRTEPDVGLVYHDVETVDGAGRTVHRFAVGNRTADGDVAGVMRRKCLRWMFRPTSTLCLSRPVADDLFPLVTTLRGNADDLVAPAAALLAPVRFIPARLSRYRIHGGNLWAGRDRPEEPGGARRPASPETPVEDVDVLDSARRYCRLLEVKTAYANLVMERAGRPGGFSPWLAWTYVKYRAQVDGTVPRRYAPEILAAARGLEGVGLLERLAMAGRLLKRSFKR